MSQIKREVASICMVDALLRGEFVRTEGWQPSYLSTELGNISRVNLIGVVVSKETSGGVLLDDGTGRILLRSFEGDLFSAINTGEVVLVIGRPRIYNEQKYVLPEIIKKLDPKWGEYRQLQLELLRKKVRPLKAKKRIVMESEDFQVNGFQKILEFIKDLDSGDGAEIGEVLKRANLTNGEELIKKLIEEGEIFEIRSGYLKILE